MKGLIFFNILLTLLIFTQSKISHRGPASTNPGSIVLAEMTITERSSLVLIGLECPVKTSVCDDWSELGFKSRKGQLSSVEPKFLVFKSNDYIEQVFTFEYGATKKKSIRPAMEATDGLILHYMKMPRQIKAKLPTKLIDTLYAKNMLRSGSRMALRIINFTPFSPLSRTIEEVVKYHEEKKFFQAAYLSRLIELAVLDRTFPEFIQVFGENNLHNLGASLRIRFRGSDSDVITSIGLKEERRAEFYEEYIRLRTEVQSVNMSKLARRASEEGLVLIPYARDFAILFYDPQVEIDKNKYNDLLIDSKLIENKERYRDMTAKDSKLVPLGAFILSHKIGPKKIVDFESPNRMLKREKVSGIITFAADIGMTFIDGIGVTTALKGGLFGGKLILRKKGILYDSANLESEAHLQALLESGAVKIESEEISRDLLAFYIDQLELEDNVLEYYMKALKSPDKVAVDGALNQIILHFQATQTGKRFSHGVSQAYKLSNKIVSWQSFKQWLERDDEKLKLDDMLNKRSHRRKKKKLERQPSSSTSDAAFVFMIDGLRPDRFREAHAKGLMPHMGAFFIRNGLQFDSYATRSLTLPSWSSILTGLDQDEHGLKSNGPMSRLNGKPSENFIDYRKDILNYGFNRENRAYKHLKESKHKWLPDYFADSEVHTNYMPVNNQAFPPVGKVFRVLLKDFQKVLFGNLSGSIALDKATALDTVSHLKKYPGKIKLVLNWFTCVDTFSHNNNKALDICYRELDKSFKLIMDQLSLDPVMKNANIYLVSDHGHTGGHESEYSDYKILSQESYFNNTALNLTTLLAGDYSGYRHFQFNPFVFAPPYPDNDLKFLQEFQIQPFNYKYKSHSQKKHKPSDVLIDFSGDSLAQIYFKHPLSGWGERLSYVELLKLNGRNVFMDLLNVKVSNNVNHDQSIRQKLKEINGDHPVMLIAHALHTCSKSDVEAIVGESVGSGGRESILLHSRTHDFGLILTKQMEGRLYYKYFLLEQFEQKEDLSCTGKLSTNPKDILGQFGLLEGKWLAKMQVIETLKKTNYPTSLVTLVGTLTQSNELLKSEKRKAEIPDLVLVANLGFNFNSSYTSEGDHGGLTQQETKNSFFYNQIGHQFDKSTQAQVLETPVLNYYLTPFVLETTGKRNLQENFNDIPLFNEILSEGP